MKKLLILLSLLLVVFVSAGCLDGIGGPIGRGWINGYIVDINTNTPICGAEVMVYGHNAWTDSYGHFNIDNIPRGVQTIAVSAPGYENYTEQLQIVPGENIITIGLTPVPVVSYGKIIGKVLDGNTYTTIAGAQIVIGGQTAYSDTYGQYNVSQVPTGSQNLEASAPGYNYFSQEFYVVEGDQYYDIYLYTGQQANMLSGTVFDNMSNKIFNAKVEVFGITTGEYFNTYSDGNGYYSITGLLGGEYTIKVWTPDYVTSFEKVIVFSNTQVVDLYLWLGQFTSNVSTDDPYCFWPAFTTRPANYQLNIYRVALNHPENTTQVIGYNGIDLQIPIYELDSSGDYIIEHIAYDPTNMETLAKVYTYMSTPDFSQDGDISDTFEEIMGNFEDFFNNGIGWESNLAWMISDNYYDSYGRTKTDVYNVMYAEVANGYSVVLGNMTVSYNLDEWGGIANGSVYVPMQYMGTDGSWTIRWQTLYFADDAGVMKITSSDYGMTPAN